MSMKKFKMLNIICESCELSGKEKQVAHYFVYKSNKVGSCYPSVKTIAEHCGVSERTVQRATKVLDEKEYIRVIPRYVKGRQSSNVYQLNTLLIEQYERDKEIEKENKNMPPDKKETIQYKEISIDEMIEEFSKIKEASIDNKDNQECPVVIQGENGIANAANRIEQNVNNEVIENEVKEAIMESEAMKDSNQERRKFQEWLKKNVVPLTKQAKLFQSNSELRKSESNSKVKHCIVGLKWMNVEHVVNMKYLHNKKEPGYKLIIQNYNLFWKYRTKYPDILDLIEEQREGFDYVHNTVGDYEEE